MNEVFSIEITATTVAWYGAVVATLSVIVGFLNFYRDRANVEVKLSQGFLAYGPELGNVQIFVEAINKGRRKVTLNSVGFNLSNKEQVVFIKTDPIRFPYELEEGKSVKVWVDKKEIMERVKKKKVKILTAWYRDEIGKVYKTKFNIK